ncbi:MAG: N-acetylneuraminate synthase family protein [Proteobacteria bacterium]|nr:N-acetylneuraminate synthase family protein [Pseudomonadota bacterium]MBU1737706.1 N-acetylneuraminate synthase family protein [Pseudomonadota bacterium]
MIIDRNFSDYIVFSEDCISRALKKIGRNEHRFIIAVSQSGILEGIMTDGDFRRWIVQQEEVCLTRKVEVAINRKYDFAYITDSPDTIKRRLKGKIEVLPLVDKQHRLVAIARKREPNLFIGDFRLNETSPVFVIAEIGNNHNGSLKVARRMIDAAIASGADCVKFQMRDMETLYKNNGRADDESADLGAQYTLDLLARFQLSTEEMYQAFDYCKEKGVLPLCTPFDLVSLRNLENYGMVAYKLASADLTNHDLLKALAETGKPLLCSTGMSTESEIVEAVDLLKFYGAQFVLLLCNSTYPAPFKDINLNYLDRLKEIGGCLVGYSGHERGMSIPIAAVSRGAKVIEKHFTLDRDQEGNDHKVSLLPDEFSSMVTCLREVEQAMGSKEERKITQGEMMNREVLGKSLIINCDLRAGEIITREMIEVKSPGNGISPYRKNELVGSRAKHDFAAGDFFFPSDVVVEGEEIAPREYHFDRPFGIPVRYHDLNEMLPLSNFDLVEFHLSYKDMLIDIDEVFKRPFALDLVLHSPELFAGDHILDLCSFDEKYRQRSLKELQEVINITRKLKKYFPKTERPLIIVNVGGATQHAHLKPDVRRKYYEKLAQSFSELDMAGVELIPQTMPPFPWHFGGQRYQNLFMDPVETAEFCKAHDMRVCLDLSHSKLACNYFKWSFSEFIEIVGPYTAHLHVVDAEGLDSEGLQIGEGDIDFFSLARELREYSPDASFIPEIWQGHKNSGEGFWLALDRLEQWFSREQVKRYAA